MDNAFRISLKSLLIGVAVLCLIFVAGIASFKYWSIAEKQRRAKLGDRYTLRLVVPCPSGGESPELRDELQGGVYRILCQPQYNDIKRPISHQLGLELSVKDDLLEISFENAIGPAGRENDDLLKSFFSDVHSYLKGRF